MGKKKISNIQWTFMIIVAVFFDAIQLGVQVFFYLLLPIPILNALSFFGVIISFSITVFASLTFFVWFTNLGLDFKKKKNLYTGLGSLVIELIPAFNALPTWTAFIVTRYTIEKANSLTKLPKDSPDIQTPVS